MIGGFVVIMLQQTISKLSCSSNTSPTNGVHLLVDNHSELLKSSASLLKLFLYFQYLLCFPFRQCPFSVPLSAISFFLESLLYFPRVFLTKGACAECYSCCCRQPARPSLHTAGCGQLEQEHFPSRPVMKGLSQASMIERKEKKKQTDQWGL